AAERGHLAHRRAVTGIADVLADDDLADLVVRDRHRRPERLCVEPAADGEQRVAEHLAFQPAYREAAEQSIIGIVPIELGPAVRGLAVSRRGHDEPVPPPELPAAL